MSKITFCNNCFKWIEAYFALNSCLDGKFNCIIFGSEKVWRTVDHTNSHVIIIEWIALLTVCIDPGGRNSVSWRTAGHFTNHTAFSWFPHRTLQISALHCLSVFLKFDLQWMPSLSVANSNWDSAAEPCFPRQKWTFLCGSEVLDGVLEVKWVTGPFGDHDDFTCCQVIRSSPIVWIEICFTSRVIFSVQLQLKSTMIICI